MLNIALELMQICSKHFFPLFLFLLLAISEPPAGAFEQSQTQHTKACRQEGNEVENTVY